MKDEDPPDYKARWIRRCLHIGEKHYMKSDDIGNCEICIPDENNIKCRLYHPISIYTFYVRDIYEESL